MGIPRQGALRRRVIQIPWHDVDMEMRHDVAEQHVVHVARTEHLLDHVADVLNVLPIISELTCCELGEASNMPTTKNHYCMAFRDAFPFEQGLADSTPVE